MINQESPVKKRGVYPYDPDYVYRTYLERINLDVECETDLATNNGFIITEEKAIKKSIKNIDGIFSQRFGQTLQDINPFADRYKCECGETMGRIYHGITCQKCKTVVRYIDDNFSYFGWIRIHKDHSVIHPNLFKSLEALIGTKNFDEILLPVEDVDENGHTIERVNNLDKPYAGIGVNGFKEKFDEIIEYYRVKSTNTSKKEYYEDIMNNRHNIFMNSIPVFTTHLRPFSIEDDNMHYQDMNGVYNMISKLAYTLNKDDISIFKKGKPKRKLLYDIQTKLNKLYEEIEKLLSGKKGNVRQLFGGRYIFTSRNVIVPNPNLRIDQVTLPYKALVELLQQTIINILTKTYHISYNDAYVMWYKASIVKNERIWEIIEGIIRSKPEGIPILINRN